MHSALRPWVLRFLAVLVMAAVWLTAALPQAAERTQQWYKGNLHTHTTHSDGDSSPDFVARWYKEHDYQFLVLSDHNYFTDPAGLNTVFGAKDRFLLLGGEEVTSGFEPTYYEEREVHVNAYGIGKLVPPESGSSVVDTIQRNVDAVLAAGGIPSLNHPNFRWSITPAELSQVEKLPLFEVYNGHPRVHNEGGGGRPGMDAMWDVALTAGRRLFGVAVDDAHHFQVFGPQYSNPGRGWVMVKAGALSGDEIWQSIRAGDFYASSGVELADVIRGRGTLKVAIKEDGDFRYTTRYVTGNGRIVKESGDLESSAEIPAGESYMRAVVMDSMGRRAWTQPVFAD